MNTGSCMCWLGLARAYGWPLKWKCICRWVTRRRMRPGAIVNPPTHLPILGLSSLAHVCPAPRDCDSDSTTLGPSPCPNQLKPARVLLLLALPACRSQISAPYPGEGTVKNAIKARASAPLFALHRAHPVRLRVGRLGQSGGRISPAGDTCSARERKRPGVLFPPSAALDTCRTGNFRLPS